MFGSPIDPDGYMSLICFMNGSLVRESVMNKTAGDWEQFAKLLTTTQPGNAGVTAFHYTHPEITPHVPAAIEVYFSADGSEVDSLSAADEARSASHVNHGHWRHVHATATVPKQTSGWACTAVVTVPLCHFHMSALPVAT